MRRRQVVAGLMTGLLAAASAVSVASGPVAKERAEVPSATPVTVAGVRYEAPAFTRTLGLPHNGGFVIAFDAASGNRLWTAQVYGLSGPDKMERDKREVFIVDLRPDPDGQHLVVTDERGRRWKLHLTTHKVTRLVDSRKGG
jgi:hypothetical protein